MTQLGPKTALLSKVIGDFRAIAGDPLIGVAVVRQKLKWAADLLDHYEEAYLDRRMLGRGSVDLMLNNQELRRAMDPFIRQRKNIKLVVDNVRQLGGKIPPVGGINWLRMLPIGSIFLVKEKNSYSYVVSQFGLFGKLGNNVSLLYNFVEAKYSYRPLRDNLVMVDNNRFSLAFEYISTIGIYSI